LLVVVAVLAAAGHLEMTPQARAPVCMVRQVVAVVQVAAVQPHRLSLFPQVQEVLVAPPQAAPRT
jgi:hypothetical protein